MAYEDKILNDLHGQRRATYPSIEEQLDALWHDLDEGILAGKEQSAFYALLKSVKDEFPKP